MDCLGSRGNGPGATAPAAGRRVRGAVKSSHQQRPGSAWSHCVCSSEAVHDDDCVREKNLKENF
jgi:hypothetical protein